MRCWYFFPCCTVEVKAPDLQEARLGVRCISCEWELLWVTSPWNLRHQLNLVLEGSSCFPCWVMGIAFFVVVVITDDANNHVSYIYNILYVYIHARTVRNHLSIWECFSVMCSYLFCHRYKYLPVLNLSCGTHPEVCHVAVFSRKAPKTCRMCGGLC